MRFLKKVSDVPVTQTGGHIIDSFNTGDDHTTNAPSLNAVETFVSYSTTEKKIGTWIDGKPLYRKVFTIGNVGTSSSATLGTISNLDTVIKLNGACYSGSLWLPIPRTHASNVQYQNQVYIDNGTVTVATGTGSNMSKGYVIVEYTKITD